MIHHNGMNFTKKKNLDFETTMNLFKNLQPKVYIRLSSFRVKGQHEDQSCLFKATGRI